MVRVRRSSSGLSSTDGRLLRLLVIAFLFPLSLTAQSSEDTLAVVKEGVLHLKRDLGVASLMVDSSAVRATRMSYRTPDTHVHTPAVMDELTNALGANRGSIASARQCATQLPSSCKLVGTEAVLEFSMPVFAGATAVMEVHSFFRSMSARQPIAAKDVIIHFNRIGDRWRVTKVTILRES